MDEAQVVPDARFAEDLNADSLDLVEAVLALEEEWSIEIPEEEMEGVKTVGQAVDLVASEARGRPEACDGRCATPSGSSSPGSARSRRSAPGVDDFWTGLDLRSQRHPADHRASTPTTFPVKLAGEVRDFDAVPLAGREGERAGPTGSSHFALASAKLAWEDAGKPEVRVGARRRDLRDRDRRDRVGSSTQHSVLLEKGPGRVSPFMVPAADGERGGRPHRDALRVHRAQPLHGLRLRVGEPRRRRGLCG